MRRDHFITIIAEACISNSAVSVASILSITTQCLCLGTPSIVCLSVPFCLSKCVKEKAQKRSRTCPMQQHDGSNMLVDKQRVGSFNNIPWN